MRTFRVTFAIRSNGDEPTGRRVSTWDARDREHLDEIFAEEMPGFFIVSVREI